jgi:integrase
VQGLALPQRYLSRQSGGDVASKLTEKTITRLKRPGDHIDVSLPRFSFRISLKGSRSWCVLARVGGKPKRITLGRYPVLTLAQARERALAVLRDVDDGKTPQPAAELPTVGKLIDDYIERGRRRARHHRGEELAESTKAEWRRYAKRVELKSLRQRIAADVTTPEVGALLREIMDTRGGWSSNRLRQFLRVVWAWGIAEQRGVTENPVAAVEIFFDEPENERSLSPDELRAVLLAAQGMDRDWRDLVWLLALTGLRLRNVLHAPAGEIDLVEKMWVVPGSRMKSGKTHKVPLSDTAIEILRDRPRVGFLFPGTKPNRPRCVSSRSVAILKRETGRIYGRPMNRWRLHDLRSTLITIMVDRLDVPAGVASRILSHGDTTIPKITRRYDKSEMLEQRREALARWDAFLRELVAEQQSATAQAS